MKSVILLLCVAVAVQAQRPRPGEPTRAPPPPPPGDNERSMCGTDDMMCPENHECRERRDMESDTSLYACVMRRPENAACEMVNLFGTQSPDEKERRAVEQDRIPEQRTRDIPQGGRDRDSSRRINGVNTRPPCSQNQRCNESQNMCATPPTDTMCTMQRQRNNATRCNDNGMYERRQCSRVSGVAALSCRCVNPMNGRNVSGTMMRVERRDDIPDCERIGTRSCRVMRDGRMVEVQHQQSTVRRMGQNCQRCRCNDGNLECNNDGSNDRCNRFDMDDSDNNERRSCMMDGEMIPHNGQRQAGKCNRCGCRNGVLQCTNLRECRDDEESDSDEERGEEDRMCDECMDMPAGPVCSMSDGRTFPTRCHAMRCQGISRDDIEDGPCSERDTCSRDSCRQGTSCFQRGGQTRMSREGSSSEDRRLCVDRQQLQCQPTETVRGERRLADRGDGEENILMRFLAMRRDNGDDEDDDQSVCASDGNQYPSTCHMMVEARGDRIPRVNHSGPCREAEQRQQVCGRDGVTYDDMQTMRTRGGNVDPDYMGRCMQQGDTPNEKCMMVRENNRCPNISRCPQERRIRPADGCCAICGAAVQMAMDQEAVDQHVRGTGELSNVDDFMGNFFREGGRDQQGRPMPPVLDGTIARRCNISATRPTHQRANTTEVIFRARDMAEDAEFCHERAMELMMKVNGEPSGTVTVETDLVAAATVAPQDEVAGAPTIVASCMMVVLAYLTTHLF